MADVTKDLLIKIKTEGGPEAAQDINGLGDTFTKTALGITGINSAMDLFSKALSFVKSGIGYVSDAAASLIDVGSTFESLGIRFDTIFGGAGPAQKALDWAVQFAATTPLTLEDVTQRMLKLKTYGFDPMGGMLESLGNTAFALGADFDGIATALGQMALKGKVSQEEINQLAERGVPAAKWLKEELGLTTAQMNNLGNAGLDVNEVIALILRNMDTNYAGAMKRAGDTWAGSMSTIADSITIFQKGVMDAGPFEFLVANIRTVRDELSAFIDGPAGKGLAEGLGKSLTAILGIAKNMFSQVLFPGLASLAGAFGDLFDALFETGGDVKSMITMIGLFAGNAIFGVVRIGESLWNGLATLVAASITGWIHIIIGLADTINQLRPDTVSEAAIQSLFKLEESTKSLLFDVSKLDGMQNTFNSSLAATGLGAYETSSAFGKLAAQLNAVGVEMENVGGKSGSKYGKILWEAPGEGSSSSGGSSGGRILWEAPKPIDTGHADSYVGGGGGSGSGGGGGVSSFDGRTKLQFEFVGGDGAMREIARLIIAQCTLYASAEGAITAGV